VLAGVAFTFWARQKAAGRVHYMMIAYAIVEGSGGRPHPLLGSFPGQSQHCWASGYESAQGIFLRGNLVRKTLLYSPEIVSWVRKTLKIIPKIPEGVRKTLGAQNILINTVLTAAVAW